ncbi:MAG: S8 family serine peptidase [Anaerolineae bacterium]
MVRQAHHDGLSKGSNSDFPKLPPAALAKIEPQLLREIIEEGQATFIVYLRDQADLSAASSVKSLAARRRAVVDTLRNTAERSQRDILALLNKQVQAGHARDILPFWVFNGVAVTGDGKTLAEIAQRDDVVKIRANHVLHLPDPITGDLDTPRPQTLLWNIERIRANKVWEDLGITGQGIVVANMDTGVDWQHNALRDKYRGKDGDHNYNWFDLTGSYPQSPGDGHNHGTHTMGTMVGDGVDEIGQRLQIGVAPGAQWIAAKIFTDSGDTTDVWIHQGFQWILAPTDLNGEDPDPTKAPDVVNNSWGSSNGADVTFHSDVQALRAAGIVPVFSAGNSGEQGDGTIGSPASFPESIAVGATEPDPVIASFSSRGPSFWDEVKPEFSAPGRLIRSSIPGNTYSSIAGTSMAAPHVSGSIALMLQAAREASDKLATETVPTIDGVTLQRADPVPGIDDLEQLLALTAVDLGAPGPDNVAGAGRIDAYRATVWAMTGGKIYGFVSDSESGTPIPSAQIAGTSTTSPEDQFTTRSASDGEFSVSVPQGRYAVEIQAFGYQPATIGNIQVVAGFLTLRNIELKRLPTGTVAGQVRTADGLPIPAIVEVVGTPITAQMDGKATYSIDLPAGVHTLRVTAAGYRTATAEVTVTVGEHTGQTFVLTPAPSTLLVDADQWFGENVSLYYAYALEKAGVPFDTRAITITDSVPTTEELSAYDIVVWVHPWTSPGTIDLQREDTAMVDALTGYLQQGGRLLLTGQDIGFLDGGGNPSNPTIMPYYTDLLHARYSSNSAPRSSRIVGNDDDIMAGIQLEFDTVYAYKRSDRGFSPDEIGPADDKAQTVFTYGNGSAAGIKVQDGNYRVVYLGFSAETAGPREDLATAMANAYTWLSRPVLTKSVDKPQAGVGERLTYTVTLENSVGIPLENATLVDPLPGEVEFVVGTATGGAVYNPDRRTIEWTGSVPARESALFTFQADLSDNLAGDTVVTNTVSAEVGDLQLQATASTLVLGPNLSGSVKAVDRERVSSGEVMTYTIQPINSSAITATDASVIDSIPPETAYVAGSVTGGATYDPVGRTIQWTGDVPAAAPVGAPYTWIDSDTAGGPAYAWDNRAEQQGAPVADVGDDTISVDIPIGFTFPFFDEEFTTFRVASNGFLSFTTDNAPFRNVALPSTEAPGNLIAPFWDDLTLSAQGTIYTWSNNVDTLVVSWVDVPRFGGSSPYTFQIILQADGEIIFQYQALGSPVDSATIGIQNSDGSVGLTIAYQEEYAHGGLAIQIRPPQPPVPPPVITFAVRVNDDLAPGSVITNTAQVDDGHGQITTLTATTQANVSDLTASSKQAPEIALPGGTFTYTLSLVNAGQVSAAVTVTDPIPSGTQYQAGSVTGGASFDSSSNAIVWSGSMLPGDSHGVAFAVAVAPDMPFGTEIRNTATVDACTEPCQSDGGALLDLVATTTVIQPDFSRSVKLVDRKEARSGDVLNYTIRIENNSPVAISEINVTDQLPEYLTFVPGSLSENATYDPTEDTVRWSGTLPARGEGYVWDDSDTDSGPEYAWDDRAETLGEPLRDQWSLGDDNSAGPFPIGFDFPFFEDSFSQFYVSTNGFAAFSPIAAAFFSNTELPSPDPDRTPGNMMAIFWDDLDMRAGGEIYYWTDHVNTLVISWVDVPHLAQGGPYTFQAILHSDGTILYQYKDMDPNRSDEATIGIQNADGSEGITVAHNELYIHDGLAVRIAPPTGKEQIRFQAEIDEGVPPESVVVNTAVVKDSLGNQLELEAKTEVNTVDLSGAIMQANLDQVEPGGRLTYRFTIPNAGTADAAQALVVNRLPQSLAYVDGSATGGAFYDPDLKEVRWQGTVPAGDLVTFEFSVDVVPPLADGDTLVNTATITDGLHPSITRSVTVQIIAPDLSRSEKQAPAMVGQGAALNYMVRIVNSGHASADVTFTDPLPAGVIFIAGSGQASYGGPIRFDEGTGTLSWTGQLPARGIAELGFSVQVVGDFDTITNTATVDDGMGTALDLRATTRVVPYRFLLQLILKNTDW